jgi:hypothetical protein
MKTRLIQSLIAVGALSMLAACENEQEAVTCRAAGGGTPFAAKFVPAGTPAPAGTVCESPGTFLALGSYDPPGVTVPSLAIGVDGTDAYPVAPDPQAGQVRLAQGEFTAKTANESNTCSAPTLTPITNTTAGITYTFSNVEMYVSAANQGTQMKGDLTIAAADGSCSAAYKVVALYPGTECAETADCKAEGTGLNPDLLDQVVCDTDVGGCVLQGNDFVKTGGDQ